MQFMYKSPKLEIYFDPRKDRKQDTNSQHRLTLVLPHRRLIGFQGKKERKTTQGEVSFASTPSATNNS